MRPLLIVALVLGACAHSSSPASKRSLVGSTFPLISSPALRLVVEGRLDGQLAEVSFDPSQPVSYVAGPCVQDPMLLAQVTVPDPFGPDETFPIAEVEGLIIAGTPFRRFEAAVAAGKTCVVVLGAPELKGLAIQVDPATREVRFLESQSAEQWSSALERSGDDGRVLPISREPRTDWPLLTVRVRQGAQHFEGPFVLSLRDPRSRIYDVAAHSAGLKAGLEVLSGLSTLEIARKMPSLAQLQGYAWDSFELAPGFGLQGGSLEREEGAPPHTPTGLLGADVWGRFRTTWDVTSNVLVLQRPRILTSGSRTQCVREGTTSDEQCFELHSRVTADGLDVIATVWAPLKEGARLSLDTEGSTGLCRVGITFSPGDRGRSSQHRFPWPKLGESLPSCGTAFTGVSAVTPGLLEEMAMPECPGVCAFAEDLAIRRLSCECQPSARVGDAAAELKLLELLRDALEKQQREHEREPEDPK